MTKSYRTTKLLQTLPLTISPMNSLGLKKKNIGLENTLSKIVENFRNSESIKNIKGSQQTAEHSSVSFKVISEEEVKNTIKD